ncbi:MAG: tRNA (cytidine(34)-2'-O)-methyltransferase [Spirochaeta sp.]|jgi:tRNA (cytidine/uridine-2'-O-)-methyltransferase|nr:tRNA (cytidine(34)-2'-O)-methyltransferase [Spirochaeta sp.]
MIHVVLVEPEIPPNTGNIARTCAATGTPLHLVQPLGFSISDRQVRRAGLDYWSDLDLHVHGDTDAFFAYLHDTATVPAGKDLPIALLTTKGKRTYTDIPLDEELYLLFGPETRGLSGDILARYPQRRYRIPMLPGQRSLNLSNSVAVVLYDLLRRNGFGRFA